MPDWVDLLGTAVVSLLGGGSIVAIWLKSRFNYLIERAREDAGVEKKKLDEATELRLADIQDRAAMMEELWRRITRLEEQREMDRKQHTAERDKDRAQILDLRVRVRTLEQLLERTELERDRYLHDKKRLEVELEVLRGQRGPKEVPKP